MTAAFMTAESTRYAWRIRDALSPSVTSHRTEPAVVRLIEDPEMRQIIYPHDDDNLASALRALNEWAAKEGWRFSGWDGFLNERIRSFLDDHPAKEDE